MAAHAALTVVGLLRPTLHECAGFSATRGTGSRSSPRVPIGILTAARGAAGGGADGDSTALVRGPPAPERTHAARAPPRPRRAPLRGRGQRRGARHAPPRSPVTRRRAARRRANLARAAALDALAFPPVEAGGKREGLPGLRGH